MKTRGFTLVEIMVAVGIIALLTALAAVSFSRQQARSRDARRVSDVSTIHTAIENYIDEKQQPPVTWAYPTVYGTTDDARDSGGWDLSSMPTGAPTFVQFLVNFGFMEKVPFDPVNDATNEAGPNTYFYHYYTSDSGTFGYRNGSKAYVLGAYLETPGLRQTITTRTGAVFGDSFPYGYAYHEPVL